jgi:hypothetical protein
MKRVLIVSPRFPPINAADVHRVRQSLPHYEEFGWVPIVVAVDPGRVEGYRDPLLVRTLPEDSEVHHVTAMDPRWTRRVGLGSLGLRALPFLAAAGSRLLASGDIDLVYFSTTEFPVLVLGRYWKRRFGVPYVVDIQDPWVTDYYERRPKAERPPKYWFSSRLDRTLEPIAMRGVAGIIAVTQAYIDDLRGRYPESVGEGVAREIPFGVSERDFEIAATLASPFPPSRDVLVGTYTGVCNSAMMPVLRVLFEALRLGREHHPRLFGRVRLRFVGTNYAPAGVARPVVLPVAAASGVEGQVEEIPERLPYLDALAAQAASDFLLLIGTRDATYTASKLYPYLFARRPLLAAFHEASTVVTRLHEISSERPVTFADPDAPELPGRVMHHWKALLERLPYQPALDEARLAPFTAREMARRQARVFDEVLAGGASGEARPAGAS